MNMVKKHWQSVTLIAIFLVGLCLMLYPSVSNWWNSFHQSRAIASYVESVAGLSDDQYEKCLEDARVYNYNVAHNYNRWHPTDGEHQYYESTLNVAGNGIMGYIEINKLHVSLPIYHGTDDEELQIAVGHLEGSSLPVGGEGTHAVISGHRGLPSAKLFTHLDDLVEGDTFIIRVLDETLTYEVDQIRIVEPENISDLGIEEGQDLVTLVTCTPYGINTHRLLVRGHRIDNDLDINTRVTADGMQIEPTLVAPLLAIPIIIVLLIILIVTTIKKRKTDAKKVEIDELFKEE